MDSDLESELISLITQLLFKTTVDLYWSWFSMAASVVTQIISLVSKMDLHSQPKPESEFMSLFMQAISVFNSIDLDSQQNPLSEFISLFSGNISLGNSMKNSKLDWDIENILSKIFTIEPEPELLTIIHKIFSLVISLNSKLGKFISVCPKVQVRMGNGQEKFHVCEEVSEDNYGKWNCIGGEWLKIRITGEDATYFWCQGCNGKNHEEYKMAPVEIKHYLHRKHSLQLVMTLVNESKTRECYCCDEYLDRIFYYCISCDFAMNMTCVKKPPDHPNGKYMELESELISLISQLLFIPWISGSSIWGSEMDPKAISLITQINLLVSSMTLNSQPKPESELMSLITQTISLVSLTDLNNQPESLSKLILLLQGSIMDSESIKELKSLLPKTFSLKPEPELISLIHQIISIVISMKSKSKKFISLWPQIQLRFETGKFWASDKGICNIKWNCLPGNWLTYNFSGEDATYFVCLGCNGENHEEYNNKAPVEIKHRLHRKHSLQLALLRENDPKPRLCYCCNRCLLQTFYCCLSCDFAMNLACAKKPPVFFIDPPKQHKHMLALFPRHASLTCNLCALDDASSPIYMCPPCDFVVHLRCIDLPRVIRISRHHHRIFFTPSFDQEDLCCGICRKYIDNDYGGYFCIKEGCSYAVHSRCATQGNVWDGKELEGEPEEDIEDVEPFVNISDGIIQHFSHPYHHLRLDDNSYRDYEENKVCQACITPIYFGNFYSSMECRFILHKKCANLSRKIYHPIHPHQLTLSYFRVPGDRIICRACLGYGVAGFYYQCNKGACDFWLHVQCATISEPLVHESHMYPLYLTSKPEEDPRTCSVCKDSRLETFNCIVECDFALCFQCATLPQKVRYKHDKHTLALSYGDETSTMTYWCEVCERKVDPKRRFYVCDEYCCVTIHIECLLGWPLYMKPGSSFFHYEESEKKVHVLSNNHHQTRPICSFCGKRCPLKIAFQWYESIFCSLVCVNHSHGRRYQIA